MFLSQGCSIWSHYQLDLQKMLCGPQFSQEHHGMSSNPQPGHSPAWNEYPSGSFMLSPWSLFRLGCPEPGVKSKGRDLWSFIPLSVAHNYILSELISYQGCSNCDRSRWDPVNQCDAKEGASPQHFTQYPKESQTFPVPLAGSRGELGLFDGCPF